jgi:hypothetical protein
VEGEASGLMVDDCATLERDGYVVLEGIVDDATVDRARDELTALLPSTPYGRQGFEGFKTQRVYALFGKTRSLDALATHPRVLAILDHVLGEYQLSAPTGIAIGPGETAQPLHPDDAIYPWRVRTRSWLSTSCGRSSTSPKRTVRRA